MSWPSRAASDAGSGNMKPAPSATTASEPGASAQSHAAPCSSPMFASSAPAQEPMTCIAARPSATRLSVSFQARLAAPASAASDSARSTSKARAMPSPEAASASCSMIAARYRSAPPVPTMIDDIRMPSCQPCAPTATGM